VPPRKPKTKGRDHHDQAVKGYLTSGQADKMLERRQALGMSEAAYVRYAICLELGLQEPLTTATKKD